MLLDLGLEEVGLDMWATNVGGKNLKVTYVVFSTREGRKLSTSMQ